MFKHVLIAQHELRGSLYFFFFFLTEVLLRCEGHFSIFSPPPPPPSLFASVPERSLSRVYDRRWRLQPTLQAPNKRDCNFFALSCLNWL